MEIGLYHPYLKERGGAERVILEYARRSSHEVTIYTMFYSQDRTFEGFQDLDVVEVSEESEPEGFLKKGLIFGLGSLFTKLDVGNMDALVVSETGLGSLITIGNDQVPIYGYVHTPLRIALPEFREEYLSRMSTIQKFMVKPMIRGYNLMEKYAWSKFERIGVNSNVTRERILNKGIFPEEKIDVINPGADVHENESGDFEKYFLYPSRFEEYKRQDLVIEAFKEADLEDFKLILAGSGQNSEYVEELRNDLPDNAEIKTDVPGEEWNELFRNAYAVLFAAKKEDWGLIPIEAGSYGKPVISVNEGGPRETVNHGETGFLTDPEPSSFAHYMRKLAEDEKLARSMGEKGRSRSKKYTWDKFAEELDAKLRDIK